MIVSLLTDGTVYGLQLSLLAVGLTLIFGLGGVLNLAHGQLVVVAGIVTAVLVGQGLSVPAAAVLGVLTAGALALVVDRSLMLPAYRYRGEMRLLLGLVFTLGLAFVIDGYLNFAFPGEALSLPVPTPAVELAGITIRTASIIGAVVAIGMLALLQLFLRGIRLGKAVRSIIQNETGAELCGIDPTRVRTLIFVMGGLLAGVVAMTQGLSSPLGPAGGFEFTVLALIVSTVGGVRSINGTIAAGILLGIVHAFTSFYVGTYITVIIFLLAAALTILLRPSGILGHWT